MQLYLKHVRNDPSEMTYDELVQLETSKLMSCMAKAELGSESPIMLTD